jgi:phosphate acyltransferase
MKIGLDIMGGDFAPEATVMGAIAALEAISENTKIVLVGNKDSALSILDRENIPASAFEIFHTSEVIDFNDHPVKAFSKKPNSSLALGFGLLKNKQIDVFASAGNTGAMMVGAMYTVKSIPGVIRPCITSILPKESGGVGVILDVGTNADCKPDVLYQFGILGSIYAQEVHGINNPKVGLLNIGEEPEKGNLLSKAAHEMMKDSKDFNFIGNVEGRDLFDDKADVIICDGFTGNVVLKEAEAFYTLIRKRKIQDDYFARFNYEIYGGTAILGINSNVVVGHGISNSIAIKNMLLLSADVVRSGLSEKIKKAFE